MPYRNPEDAKAYGRRYQQEHRPECAAKTRRYMERHPDYSRKRLYGLDQATYEAMRLAQDNKCAICGKEMDAKREPHTDHNHETGQVRDLLCHGCNTRLHALENLQWRQLAEAYLEKWKQ